MNDMRLTDAQLAVGLRAIVPSEAQAGLHARILAEVGATHQERPLPTLLGRLTDADPDARRRALLLLAAAALLAIGVAAAGVVGALLNERQKPLSCRWTRRRTSPASSARPTTSCRSCGRSRSRPSRTERPRAGSTSTARGRSGSRRSRRRTLQSPTSYKIFAGTTLGQLTTTGSRRVWSQQTDAISEDPRVFVFATMGAERRLGQPGCEVAISQGEVYHDTPGPSLDIRGRRIRRRPTDASRRAAAATISGSTSKRE